MDKKLNAIGKGEMDYDYEHDLLFFKVKDRFYDHSIEFGDVVIDFDPEGYPTGVQVFDASKFFHADKIAIHHITHWRFAIEIHDTILTIFLLFSMVRRNKVIECRSNIERPLPQSLQNTLVECTTP